MKRGRAIIVLVLSVLALTAPSDLCSSAAESNQPTRQQFRAFWVDAFHPGFKSAAEIDSLIADARTANANALLIQVRRRGDAYYLKSLEPPAEDSLYDPRFDALQATIDRAHAQGIEVHAFVATMAIWQTALGPAPLNPNHVFNQHGPNQVGRDFWLCQSNTGSFVAPGGRIYLDPGHPDAADYTVRVLMHLVQNYDLDGLHLDVVRYPEGGEWGYNPVSLARFQQRYNRTDTPAPGDADFKQWRQEQVTNLVRRIYLNILAAKPRVKLSMAAIAFGAGPVAESDWLNSAAYSQVYQDWRAWLEEGIIDMAIPMNYDREHVTTQRNWFNDWIEWDKNHRFNRHVSIGLGIYLNSIEGSLQQIRRALNEPSRQNQWADGVALYSYATTNAAAPPSGAARPNAEFYRALSQPSAYDPNPAPVFAERMPTPEMPWKTHPTTGHLMGVVRLADGRTLDGGVIEIRREVGSAIILVKRTRTDGRGFFGAVDLEPGFYQVNALQDGSIAATGWTRVVAGEVTTVDVTLSDGTHVHLRSPNVRSSHPPSWVKCPIVVARSSRCPQGHGLSGWIPIPTAATSRSDRLIGSRHSNCSFFPLMGTIRKVACENRLVESPSPSGKEVCSPPALRELLPLWA